MKLLKKPLVGYSSFVAASAIIVLGKVLDSPSEPDSAVFLGLSLPRLVMALGLFIAAIVFFTITIRAAKDYKWAEKFLDDRFGHGRFRRVTAWLGGISFGVGWTGIFVPVYYVRGIENYWVRLQPVFLFIVLVGAATLAMLYISQRKEPIGKVIQIPIFRGGMLLFIVCMPVVVFMLYSKFGMYSLEDFWYGAGVPILFFQLILAIVGGLIFISIEHKHFKHLDLIVFILLFAFTSFLWAREPLQKSFLLIGPFAPNQALYPFADAARFDIGSQFALIGRGIFTYNSYFFERPLYLSFLVYLHSIFGQDYQTLMAAQAGIFAIFPALVYLIGKSLNLRSVGFAAALVAMFRGVNSIAASNMIDMANVKMMLTDFPSAIGVALVILATCEWLKAPVKNQRYAVWLGGALGFTLMLRTNALLLLALIPVYAFFKLAPDWKKWLFQSFLIVVAVIAITLPWELRNQSLGGQMYGPIIGKFRAVINTRYISPIEPSGFVIPNLITLQNTHVLSTLYQGNAKTEPDCSSVLCFVLNHFLHNLATSVLTLPTSLVMDDLRHTVGSNPYWNPLWDGVFAPWALFFFVLNLFLVLLGISVAWHQSRLPGITPLAVLLFYNLSNAFARTSGGRYIVPMDWIITIYFLLGVLQVIFWFANTLRINWKFEVYDPPEHINNTKPAMANSILVLCALLGIGFLIPFSEKLHPERYEHFNIISLLVDNEQTLSPAGLDMQAISSFQQNNEAAVLIGRALYPRYYKKDQGEPIFYPTLNMPFPRTTFTLIGPDGENGVILPGEVPTYFPHATDVLVIGCRNTDYLDALAVIVLDEKSVVYTREPKSELQCPLQQPVCDNNSNCK